MEITCCGANPYVWIYSERAISYSVTFFCLIKRMEPYPKAFKECNTL